MHPEGRGHIAIWDIQFRRETPENLPSNYRKAGVATAAGAERERSPQDKVPRISTEQKIKTVKLLIDGGGQHFFLSRHFFLNQIFHPNSLRQLFHRLFFNITKRI
jgi:hypothetical protein